MVKPPETITAYHDNTGYHFTARDGIPRFEGVEYVRADLSPKVKALVWERDSHRGFYYGDKASAPTGVYRVTDVEGSLWVVFFEERALYPARYGVIHTFTSEKAAKAAAQAHYEALILGCLE